VKNGVSEKQIKTKGYGSEKPLVGNDTENGSLQNRRVEFIILKK
jgi:outer membrane protein OmpA-like peptidoglycan-associated protein